MKPSVYIETSLVSYLVSRPSKNLIVAAQQQITNEWWDTRRVEFDLYVSQLVIGESSRGDVGEITKRLETIKDIPLLELRVEARELANILVKDKVLPEKAADDALHISVATIYGIDYLLTWNCKHMANAEIQKQLSKICGEQGYELPIICTPYELMGE